MCSIFAARTFHIKMQMKADMSEEGRINVAMPTGRYAGTPHAV